MERTPKSRLGSDPDLSRFNIHRRKQHNIEACHCESSILKFKNEIMETISNTVKASVESAITDKIEIIYSDLETFKKETKEVLHGIGARMADIEDGANFASNRQDTFDSRLSNVEKQVNKINQWENEIASLRKECRNLNLELHSRQQWDRMQNLEIVGIPEINNENLINIIMAMAKSVDATMAPEDIEFINRIQPKKAKPGVPRTIIVKLKNRVIKDNVLAGIRRFRGITRSNFGLTGDERVFVNEHLTPENKNLYFKCRELVKSNSYKYCWIRNCKIFVRRGDKSPKIAITKEEDLLKIK